MPRRQDLGPEEGLQQDLGCLVQGSVRAPSSVCTAGGASKVSEDLRHWQGRSWWGHKHGSGCRGSASLCPTLDGLPGGGELSTGPQCTLTPDLSLPTQCLACP